MTSIFQDKRILITGATGFVGGHLVAALAERGAILHTMARGSGEELDGEHLQGNLTDQVFLDRELERIQPQIIFHLAGYKERQVDLPSFREAIEINLLGSLNLFQAAQRLSSLERLVVVGTAEEYGNNASPFEEDMPGRPVNSYSFSKFCVTTLASTLRDLYHMPFVVIRPTIAYGPRQMPDMFLPALIRSLMVDRPFPMTDGMQTRDYVYVTDLVEALMQAGVSEAATGEIINIGSGVPIRIAELAQLVEELLGKPGLAQLGKLPYRSNEMMDYYVSIEKARNLLQWKPRVSLRQGLEETIACYQVAAP